ncbi:MAG: 16S rRNA (cytosine(1402)-N(4))-methyltransferase [Bacteroidetes bacterium]|nr:16S rRNA (cytosine(1402)-N(4))-methyltransferase [Bacteroidota bacterium]
MAGSWLMDFEWFADRLSVQPIRAGHLISTVQNHLREAIRPGDILIDATAGNGNDTLFLSSLAGETGRVYAFDIQQAALDSTRKRLETYGSPSNVRLIHDSHQAMKGHVGSDWGSVSVIMFNLGYLPGGDHHLTTQTSSTCEAILQAHEGLRQGGLLSVMFYPGHEEGSREALAVADLIQTMEENWQTWVFGVGKTLKPAPFALIRQKVH